jgi:hypothetical protein
MFCGFCLGVWGGLGWFFVMQLGLGFGCVFLRLGLSLFVLGGLSGLVDFKAVLQEGGRVQCPRRCGGDSVWRAVRSCGCWVSVLGAWVVGRLFTGLWIKAGRS